jgi:hypothetical protein
MTGTLHTPTRTRTPSATAKAGSSNNATVIRVFDPAVSKLGVLQPGGIGLPGEKLTWTITATNSGGTPGYNVKVTDPVIAALKITGADTSQGTFAIVGQMVTFDLGTLMPGQTVTMHVYTVVVGSPSQAIFTNMTCLTASGVGPKCTNAPEIPGISKLPSTGYPQPNVWPLIALSAGALFILSLGGLGVIARRRARPAK